MSDSNTDAVDEQTDLFSSDGQAGLKVSTPHGWARAKLEELCELNPKHPKDTPNELEVSFVPMKAVCEKTGMITDATVRPFGEVRKGYTHFADGDVIFAKITPCMENGKAASVRNLRNGIGCGTTEFYVFRSHGAIEQDFLFKFIRQSAYRKLARAQMQSGVGQARVPKDFVLGTEIPLPPSAEQRRIVSAIESLQERSSRAKQALSEVGPLLSQLRQSVLRSAFNGDLTADWRAQNPHVEPASELLARIRTERRERWEAEQLAKYEEKGKKPPKNWQDKYKEPEPVDESELPELPEGWCWIRLPEVGYMNRGKSRHRPRNAEHLYGGPYPFVQTGDISRADGKIENHTQTYSEAGLEQSRLWPEGTVGITIAANIASTAVLTYPACFPDSVVGVIPDEEVCSPEYVEYFIRTAKEELERFAPSTAQKNINLGTLAELSTPFPPPSESAEIVRLVNAGMDRIKAIEAALASSEAELTNLDQSILAKAFRGELVPQDPSDEPASELLKRIREKRFLTETKSLKEPIKVVRLGAEGGGAEIMATVKKGVWSFWQEGSFMDFDKDDNEIWRKFKTDPVGSIGEVIEDEWWFYYPRDPHPAFVPSLRDWYQDAFEKLSETDKQKHSEFQAREWQEMFLEAGLK